MRLLISFALALAACRSAPAPAPAKPAPAPVATNIAGKYELRSTGCHGTPENPTCTERLTLAASGTGEFTGDDIVEDATWKLTGSRVTVALSTWQMELTVMSDGSLADARGGTWTRVID